MEDRPSWVWLRQAPQGIHARRPAAPRLGVLSSPFNPPTRAHLALAEAALTQLDLHEVVCVLPARLPHKPELELPLSVRADLLRRALENHPRMGAALCSGALLLEIYEALAPVYPAGTRVYFLLGSDAAERILLAWPYPDRAAALAAMFSRFEVAVADREKKFDPASDLSCGPMPTASIACSSIRSSYGFPRLRYGKGSNVVSRSATPCRRRLRRRSRLWGFTAARRRDRRLTCRQSLPGTLTELGRATRSGSAARPGAPSDRRFCSRRHAQIQAGSPADRSRDTAPADAG